MKNKEKYMFFYLVALCIFTFRGLNFLSFFSLIIICISSYCHNMRLQFAISQRTRYIFFLAIIYMVSVTFINYKFGTPNSIGNIWSELINKYFMVFFSISIMLYKLNVDRLFLLLRKISWLLVVFGVFEELTRVNPFLTTFKSDYAYNLIIEGRISSIFQHPIVYAFVLVFLLFVALYYPYKNNFKNYLLRALIFINILFTRTRGIVVAILFILLLRVLRNLIDFFRNTGSIKYSKKILFQNFFHFILILVGLIYLVFSSNAFVSDYIERLLKLKSLSDQGVRIAALLNYGIYFKETSILRILFGSGEGFQLAFLKLYPIYNWDSTVDNMFLNFLLNYGIIGMFILFYVLFRSIKYYLSINNEKNLMVAHSFIIACSISFLTFDGLYWPIILGLYDLSLVITLINKKAKMKQS